VPHRDIVAIGTSAGGVDALRSVTRKLSPDFDATILVVIHLASGFSSSLDRFLSQNGPLPASFARDDEKIEPGHIYLAPPDRHLLLDGHRLLLGRGPRENNAKPAIDPLFRSVGLCCGGRAIGIVLSGMLGDGAAGLLALKQCGGITVVQEPSDAAYAEMPEIALRRAQPDHVAALSAMPALLTKLIRQPSGEPVLVPERIKFEVEIARSGHSNMNEMDRIGRRSLLACPDCHGVMWEIDEGDLVRYRCHVGHAYTAETAEFAIDENLTGALASALRALDERVAVTQTLRDKAVASGHNKSAEWWTLRNGEVEHEAEVIRESILRIEELIGDNRRR
jgi:two-component system chemotaxis response regulator CheB